MAKKRVLIFVALAVAFCAVPAVADTVAEVSGSGFGTYAFPGTLGSSLSGCSTGLIAWEVTPILGTPVTLPRAELCFTSGPADSFGLISTFGAGGLIWIRGGYCEMGCFLGSFTGPQYDTANSVFSAPFIGQNTSPAFWLMLGLYPLRGGGNRATFTATLIPTSDERGLIESFDLTVYPEPEPSSIALLGSGLLIGGFVRRKFA